MKRGELAGIRLLPPLVVARLGAAEEPVGNYDVVVDPQRPLGFRTIRGAPTFLVDVATGAITGVVEQEPTFKDAQNRVRPVAPFLELWGRFDGEDEWIHLTTGDLADAGVAAGDVRWRVHVGNVKVTRRTGDPDDRIEADTGWFSTHDRQSLRGQCPNFVSGKSIPLGYAQYIRPTGEFPHIRLRFTPGSGNVYGSNRATSGPDPNIVDEVYDASKGTWFGYSEPGAPIPPQPHLTNPGAIYAGTNGPNNSWVSFGYLDDACDGIIDAELTVGGHTLGAFARVGAGAPAFAPDTFPIRTAADELEQILLGPDVDPDDYSVDELQQDAEEILRRAFEAVRLMNTAYMNGNDPRDIASTMSRQDHNDTGRAFEPIMAPTLVDTLAVLHLHQSVFMTLRSGAPPWFVTVLREFDEIGDLTDLGRRKMPGMMRNADARYLVLTRRQRDKIRLAANRTNGSSERATTTGDPADE